jgi:Icc-related predicted phosphoesterase
VRITTIADAPFWEIPYHTAGPGGTVATAVLPLLRATVDFLPPFLDALLTCADLQGRGLPVANGIATPLLGELLAEEMDMLAIAGEVPAPERTGVLLLGDFYAGPNTQARGDDGDVQPVWQAFAERCRWVVGVAGNHDVIEAPPLPAAPTAHLLDGKTIDIDGLRFGGVSGIIGEERKGRPWRRREEHFISVMRTVLQAEADILLLHQGPDAGGEQPGHPAIRAGISAAQTPLVLCGHVHWQTALAVLPSGTQVLNVDGRAVLLTG